jgi:hypothetical protein
MLRWYVDGARPPRQVECDPPGYPHKDVDGRVQYKNTHFDNEDDAWAKARREAEAGISLDASAIREAERVLATVRERAADSLKEFADLMEAERQRRKGEPTCSM